MTKPFSLDNQLCFEIYKASNQFTKLYRQVLNNYDLTYPQYIVLLALWEQDHMLVKQLGEKVELGIGTLNPIINKLVEKNFVTKQTAEDDKRAIIVSLTEKAKKMESIITEAIASKVLQCAPLLEVHENLQAKLKELNTLLKQLSELEALQ